MTFSVALPAGFKERKGSVLTFVVPAPNGCNLKCPFCFISQRREDTSSRTLSVEHYVEFLNSCILKGPVAAVCIQGHEPLLPESFDYTRRILEVARDLAIPTSLVTNGTYLDRSIESLLLCRPEKVAVSLDASKPEEHDRLRGKKGVFYAATEALWRAQGFVELQGKLSVTSVLIPKRRHILDDMPEVLSDLGIDRWTLNALVKVSPDGSSLGGPIGERSRTFHDLTILQRIADSYGIEMTVDDEFGQLSRSDLSSGCVEINRLRVKRLISDSGVFRLTPDGVCSVGIELLQQINGRSLKWNPGQMNSGEFVDTLYSLASRER